MFLRCLKVFLVLWTVSESSEVSRFGIRMESVNNLAGEEETLAVYRYRLVGRERFLNGTLTLLADLDEKYEGAIDIYSFKNGEWTQSYIKIRTTPCDLYTNYLYKYYFPPNADTNLVPGGDNCFKKGEYYFRKIPIDVSNWPTLPFRGTTKQIVTFSLKDKRVGGFETICTICDKPT